MTDGVVEGPGGNVRVVVGCFGDGVWIRVRSSESMSCNKRCQENEAA